MKIVRTRVDEVKRDRSVLSGVSTGASEMVNNIISGTYRKGDVSTADSIGISEGDDANGLYSFIAGKFGSSNVRIIDVVSYNMAFGDKHAMKELYEELLSITDGVTHEIKIGDDAYSVIIGRYFALVWGKDIMHMMGVPRDFYVFVDNRNIRL